MKTTMTVSAEYVGWSNVNIGDSVDIGKDVLILSITRNVNINRWIAIKSNIYR